MIEFIEIIQIYLTGHKTVAFYIFYITLAILGGVIRVLIDPDEDIVENKYSSKVFFKTILSSAFTGVTVLFILIDFEVDPNSFPYLIAVSGLIAPDILNGVIQTFKKIIKNPNGILEKIIQNYISKKGE